MNTIISKKLLNSLKSRPKYFNYRQYVDVNEIFGKTPVIPINSENHSITELPQSIKVDGRFISPWASEGDKNTAKVIKWLATRKPNKLNLLNGQKLEIQEKPIDMKTINRTDASHFTWMGHASCYYQSCGK